MSTCKEISPCYTHGASVIHVKELIWERLQREETRAMRKYEVLASSSTSQAKQLESDELMCLFSWQQSRPGTVRRARQSLTIL